MPSLVAANVRSLQMRGRGPSTPRHRREPLTRHPYSWALTFEPGHALRSGSEADNALFCWQKCSPGSSEDVGSGLSFWFCRGASRTLASACAHMGRRVNGNLCALKCASERERWLFLYRYLISGRWWPCLIAGRIGSDWTLDVFGRWALGPRPQLHDIFRRPHFDTLM